MQVKFSKTYLTLRRRIWIAVSLVSVIPAVVLLNHFFSEYIINFYAYLILIILVILGWWVIIEILASIHKIHSQSKKTLETIGEKAPLVADEVQSLEQIINLLSNKVKSGFEDLREFGAKTEELNREVSKKVLVLSTILQANHLYSKDTPAEEVVQFLVYHLKNLLAMDVVFCALQSHSHDKLRVISALGRDSGEIERLLAEKKNISQIKKAVIVDSQNRLAVCTEWSEAIGVNNLMVAPVASKGTTIGVVGAGNKLKDFTFQKEDSEVLSLFSQNITLIWEYERVSSKVEELEIFDNLTGLYNAKMFKKRLSEEIRRATVYQRPCGFIAVKIKNYKEFQEKNEAIEAEKAVKKAAKIVKENIRPIDVGGRIFSDTLAAILIEQNKRQSQAFCDLLKEKLKESCEAKVELNLCVAESPVDGATAEEILSFAQSQIG